MKKLSRERMNLRKISGYAMIINSIQILGALAVALLALFLGDDVFTGTLEQAALAGMALVVIWGGILDIRDARSAKHIGEESDMLEAALGQLNELNGTLRAQRHDFMNHLQVVYSLMEMREYDDAQAYIEKVYTNIQKVSRSLKTAIPAVNALLASKLAECEEKRIEARLQVGSSWAEVPVADWELCRVLSNLIDNAMDALKGTPQPTLQIDLSETIHAYTFEVSNNGPEVPEEIRERIFQQGFSTKGDERGMGLSIVKEILDACGGELSLTSAMQRTCFWGTIPKSAPEL